LAPSGKNLINAIAHLGTGGAFPLQLVSAVLVVFPVNLRHMQLYVLRGIIYVNHTET
jgi:shikimate kinase